MNTLITPAQIFEKGQILTLDKVPSLTGKTISITNAEYKYNTPSVRTFKVLGVESEYEAAGRVPNEKYGTQQKMWIAENNTSAIEWAKNRTVLIYNGETPYATVENGNACLPEGTFFGSDADREIYFVTLD